MGILTNDVVYSLHNKFNCKHNIHTGQNSTDNQPNNNNSQTNNKNIAIMVPNIHGLGERFKRTCNSRGNLPKFENLKDVKEE